MKVLLKRLIYIDDFKLFDMMMFVKKFTKMKRTLKKNLLLRWGSQHIKGKIYKKSLISILNQTYKNTEIIICDDNSNDKTLEICKSICKKRDVKILKNLKISERKKILFKF